MSVDAPRLLLTCEDPVLLEAMTRIVVWSRPRWVIESVQGLDGVRRALRERAFDVIVCAVEPRAPYGEEVLYLARVKHSEVCRVAYRTAETCEGAELDRAHSRVSWPANIRALIEALDRAVSGGVRGQPTDTEYPPRALAG